MISKTFTHLAAAAAASARAARGVQGWTDEAIAEWVGLALPPARLAIEQSDWSADAPGAWCRRCGASIGAGESTDTGCAACRVRGGIGHEVVRLGAYAGDLRSWILQVKFGRWFEMADALGGALGRSIIETSAVERGRVIVTPVPMPWTRRLYRGIDHSRAIAEGVASELGCPVVRTMSRSSGAPQVSMAAGRRRRVGGKGMRLRRRWRGRRLAGLHVVVVDDVLTTGGTMRAAARLLRSGRPARVVAGVLAVTDEPGRRSPGARAVFVQT